MNRFAFLLFVAAVALLANCAPAIGLGGKPGIKVTTKKSEIDMFGTAGPVDFTLTELKKGQKLAVSDWLKKLEIGGKAYDIEKDMIFTTASAPFTKGSIAKIPKSGLKPGKYKVKFTVELNDGTRVDGEAEVEFVPIGGITPPPPATAEMLAPRRRRAEFRSPAWS